MAIAVTTAPQEAGPGLFSTAVLGVAVLDAARDIVQHLRTMRDIASIAIDDRG